MKINNVVKNLILSDIFILSGFGLILPIFAIFIEGNIDGATVEVIGFSWTIYLISKSMVQLPIAGIVDKIKGEKDDFLFLLIGSLLFSMVPILYIFTSTITGLYIVQFIYGVLTGTTLPAWSAIYTRHIDKKHEGFEWSIWSTSVSVGGALSSAIGGVIAQRVGFEFLFLVVTIISLIGTIFIVKIYKNLYKINFFQHLFLKIKK